MTMLQQQCPACHDWWWDSHVCKAIPPWGKHSPAAPLSPGFRGTMRVDPIPLTEEDVRRIVREEVAALASARSHLELMEGKS